MKEEGASAQQGAEALVVSPEELGKYLRGEVDKWALVVGQRKLPPID